MQVVLRHFVGILIHELIDFFFHSHIVIDRNEAIAEEYLDSSVLLTIFWVMGLPIHQLIVIYRWKALD